MVLQEYLKSFGLANIAVNGKEAVDAVRSSLEINEPYNLICMDIMMPDMDGQQALRDIRTLEETFDITFTHGAKIIMTSALSDMRNKFSAFSGLCNGYLTKPIHREQLLEELNAQGLC